MLFVVASGTGVPSGGGISNTGTMIIIAGTVQSNMGFWSAGGIYNTGMLTITGSTIIDNQTGDPGHFGAYGGGIVNDGTMTIQDSTISGNTALGGDLQGGEGGGISGNNNTITNSTITGNSALHGGGVAGGGNIAHTTFSNNSANRDGGALYLTSSLELGNTILKAGTSGVNIFNNGGSLITHGYNVCSDNGSGFLNGPGDQINTDPILGPLQNNGGPTLTHALLPGSPAIDAGDPNFTPPPDYDQRGPGFVRVFNGRIDVGSFEVQPTPTPTPTLTPTATATPTPTATLPPSPTPTPTATPTCIPTVIYGSINNGDPTQVNRVFRSGTASTCGGPLRPCSIATAGAVHYNAYSFTNTTGSTQCVSVNLNTSCGGTHNIFTVAYLGSFDPNNVCTNYLADEGESPNRQNQFSFNLDNGQAVVLVVSEVTSGAGCPSYVMTVSGVCIAGPTPTPTPTPSATATPSGSPACTVTSPVCGIDVHTRLTDFIVNASGSVDPATLQPSDFTCNGIPAHDGHAQQ